MASCPYLALAKTLGIDYGLILAYSDVLERSRPTNLIVNTATEMRACCIVTLIDIHNAIQAVVDQESARRKLVPMG